MSFLLVMQYDCDTHVIAKLSEASEQSVFDAIMPSDLNDRDITKAVKKASKITLKKDIIKIGDSIPVDLDSNDPEYNYYLIDLKD